MNKILPIILAVVLSGCGPSAFEKQCYERYKRNQSLEPNDKIGFSNGKVKTIKEHCYDVGVYKGAIR